MILPLGIIASEREKVGIAGSGGLRFGSLGPNAFFELPGHASGFGSGTRESSGSGFFIDQVPSRRTGDAMKRRLPVLLPLVLLAPVLGCRENLRDTLNARLADPMSGSRNMDVFVLTNRATSNATTTCSSGFFSNQMAAQIRAMRCTVNVPAKHSVGALDTSPEPRADRDIYFAASSSQAATEEELYAVAEKAKEVLLFVHGFNVPFDEALVRAAQIKYDVKYQRPVFLFTWPAGSGDGMLDGVLMNRTYAENQKNARASVDQLARVFQELRRRGVAVHLMVHSMGHQIAIPALLQVARDGGKRPFIEEAIFNAPDYPSGEFIVEAPTLRQAARRITLYCSPGDNALIASQKMNGNYRIGMCLRVDGVDVINVNEIDSPVMGVGGLGHGYYSGRAILADLYQTLLGIDAERRLFVRTSSSRMEHYVLRR